MRITASPPINRTIRNTPIILSQFVLIYRASRVSWHIPNQYSSFSFFILLWAAGFRSFSRLSLVLYTCISILFHLYLNWIPRAQCNKFPRLRVPHSRRLTLISRCGVCVCVLCLRELIQTSILIARSDISEMCLLYFLGYIVSNIWDVTKSNEYGNWTSRHQI